MTFQQLPQPSLQTVPARRADAILDSRLHPKVNLGRPDLHNADFFGRPANRAHVAAQWLLYERVVIPTSDFAIVPALLTWLGPKDFEAALDAGALSFVRRRGILCYVGNGNAVSECLIRDSPERPFHWCQEAIFGPFEKAIELQLLHGVPSLKQGERTRLGKAIKAHSLAAEYPNEFFIQNIAEESYRDVRDTPELSRRMRDLVTALGHPESAAIDLLRLPGVEANAVQVVGDSEILSPADLVLRVAQTNTELALAGLAGGADVHISFGGELILRRKLARALSGNVVTDGFFRLLELNGIPDIRVAVESGAISLRDIWKMRQRRVSRQFRKWLASCDAESPRDLERLYIETLGERPLVQSLPARALRFVLTTGAGALGPAVGAAAGFVDTFFVDRFLSGFRPKLLFDEMRTLIPTQTESSVTS